MTEEFKKELIDVVSAATEVLNDEDALEIVRICKGATDREIADLSERCLMESLKGGDAE